LRTTAAALTAALVTLAGCATAPSTPEDRKDLKTAAVEALGELKSSEPSLTPFLERAAGCAVFPHIGKGGYFFGGGYGRGIVYRREAEIGYTDITQASFGLQFGGQAFMELLVFESERDLERFTAGRLSLTANASAVILKSGEAFAAKYTDGVAVFVKPIGGAMVEASVGGQQFSYQPN